MTESEYVRLADEVFRRLEAALDDLEDDVEYEMAPGGVLELEFTDGSKMVMNRQAAVREIWLAARSGGFHYRWDGASWVDTRTGEELFTALTRLMGEQAGRPLSLA